MYDLDEELKPQGELDYLSNEEYHKIEALSASGLKMMAKSFRLYYLKHALLRTYSPALDMGTALHEAVLEPERFDIDNYPEITAAQSNSLRCMINNTNVMFGYILNHTENEASFLCEDKELEVKRKIRVDAYDRAKGIVYDLKSTRHGTPKQFEREAYELGYHIQAAWNLDTLKFMGLPAKHFAFLVTPSISPFEPYAYVVTKELLEEGRAQYAFLINGYNDFLKTDQKEATFMEMGLPYFLQKD